MTETSEADQVLLLRFEIKKTLLIRLAKLKVSTFSNKGVEYYKSHFCKYSSNCETDLYNHLQTHTKEKPFPCTLCQYKSSRRQTLNDHILTHTGEKPWNCAFCKKPFSQNGSKTRHEIICKLNPRQNDPGWVEMQRAFKCQLCRFSTADKSNLKSHMMTHTREKPFQCNLCNKKFRAGDDMRRHIFTHTREKPHSCQFCNRGFARVASHKSHENNCKLNPKQGDAKWVEEQKAFKCHFCTYRTTMKKNLEKHLSSHTGEKLYKCPLCFYKCSQNSCLHQHLKNKHVTEKGYKCPECDLAILSTSNLLTHFKQFHDKKS